MAELAVLSVSGDKIRAIYKNLLVGVTFHFILLVSLKKRERIINPCLVDNRCCRYNWSQSSTTPL